MSVIRRSAAVHPSSARANPAELGQPRRQRIADHSITDGHEAFLAIDFDRWLNWAGPIPTSWRPCRLG